MKPIKTLFFTGILTSAAAVAAARGFGFSDRSDTAAQGTRDGTRAPAVSSGQDAAGARSAPGFSRGYSAAPAQTPSPRVTVTPAPTATYTPADRSSSRLFSGGSSREAAAPQPRTYTAPQPRTYTAPQPSTYIAPRTDDSPRTTVVREAPARTFTGATRDSTPTVQTVTPPRVISDSGNGTSRGLFRSHADTAVPAPAVTPAATVRPDTRAADGRSPFIRSNTTRGTEPAAVAGAPKPATPAASPKPKPVVPSAPAVDTRAADGRSPFIRSNTTRGTEPAAVAGDPKPATPAASPKPKPVVPSATAVDTRAADGRWPFAHSTTRGSEPGAVAGPRTPDSAGGSRTVTSHSQFQRIPTPDTRLSTPTASRGTSSLRFGSAGDNTRSRTSITPPSYGTAGLRSTRHGGDLDRGTAAPTRSPIPSRLADNHDRSGWGDRGGPTASRYPDGRFSVYHAPDRPSFIRGPSDYHPRPEPRDHHDRHPGYHYTPYAYRDYHHAFRPVWCGPVVYPTTSYFGFSWSSGSFGMSFASYSPAYTYSYYRPYCYTPYYDSWSCGGWGYSGVYYGGWRHHWYGGFSYVYNPWPVYRTYYFYEPAPVVETVYVTQPAATTYVVQSPAPVAVVQPQPAVAAVAAAQPQAQAAAAVVTENQQVEAAAPVAAQTVAEAAPCSCSCHCNGQRPCTCAYPCGSEYAVTPDQFDLSFGYSSYAETLAPETIWSSYAGLDRSDAYESNLSDETVSAETNLH